MQARGTKCFCLFLKGRQPTTLGQHNFELFKVCVGMAVVAPARVRAEGIYARSEVLAGSAPSEGEKKHVWCAQKDARAPRWPHSRSMTGLLSVAIHASADTVRSAYKRLKLIPQVHSLRLLVRNAMHCLLPCASLGVNNEHANAASERLILDACFFHQHLQRVGSLRLALDRRLHLKHGHSSRARPTKQRKQCLSQRAS